MMRTLFSRSIFLGHAELLLLAAACLGSLFFTGFEGSLFFLSQLFLWGFFTCRLLSASDRLTLPVSCFSLFLFLFCLYSVLTLFWTPVPGYTEAMVWRQGSLLLLFVALLLTRLEESYWVWLQSILVLLASVMAVWGIGQFFLGEPPRASFLNKNSLAGFLLPLVFWIIGINVSGWRRMFYTGALVSAGIVIGLIGSRGALLALLLGLICLWAAAGRGNVRISWRKITSLLAGVLLSMAVTGLDTGLGLGRLGSLGDPLSAGADRLVIWQASWEMLRDAPWYGIGAGIYGLIYPAYRLHGDASAGHFAHNDLLQLAIETGWPGLLLGLAAFSSFALLVWRGLKLESAEIEKKRELSGMAAGLAAVSFHSLFTFNFYIYATLLLIAVMLARSYFLLPQKGVLRVFDMSHLGSRMKYLLVALCLIPLTLLCLRGASQLATNSALELLRQDKITESFRSLKFAMNFWPSNDFNWYMEGEALRLGLASGLRIESADQQYLFERARAAFAKAAELNPYRAAVPHKLGLLLSANEAAGDSSDTVTQFYRHALEIDPRYFPARIELARIYQRENRFDQARGLVEEGLSYYYQDVPGLIPYLELAVQLRAQNGDQSGVEELLQKIQQVRTKWQGRG